MFVVVVLVVAVFFSAILLYGQDANDGMFKMIHEVMSELIVLRRRLLSSALTQGQIVELKSRIASKIDWGNKYILLSDRILPCWRIE